MDNLLVYSVGGALILFLAYKGILKDLLAAALYYTFRGVQAATRRSMVAKWTAKSLEKKDVIILHKFDDAAAIPNLSPFVLKLETYMRMAKIHYEVDTSDPLGPKNKSPWISYNGEHYTDSQLIIEWLESKFGQDLNKGFTQEQQALATVVRVTMDEYIFWSMSMWALWHDTNSTVFKLMPGLSYPLYASLGHNARKMSWGHGIGRHSFPDILNLVCNALRAFSVLLGEKKFLLGNEPCTEDAAVFGQLSQFVWGLGLDSPYQKFVDEELPNIRPYCERMREKFWPDWDMCLAK